MNYGVSIRRILEKVGRILTSSHCITYRQQHHSPVFYWRPGPLFSHLCFLQNKKKQKTKYNVSVTVLWLVMWGDDRHLLGDADDFLNIVRFAIYLDQLRIKTRQKSTQSVGNRNMPPLPFDIYSQASPDNAQKPQIWAVSSIQSWTKINTFNRLRTKSNQLWRCSGYISIPNFRPFSPSSWKWCQTEENQQIMTKI